ncbi:MAG: helix-turn-helix transcriptional regulator [Chloroflexi bacterium]|nr:helix-turn-helix transcriptional regulator [Chloroflexota bacterium]
MSVRNALLGLLAQRPRHGYELHAAFVALAGGQELWDVKPAQVYTTLARLADAGLVTQEGVEKEGGPEKRIYAITSAGQEELTAWLNAGVPSEHQRDESYIKLMLSLSLDMVDPYHVIRVQRNALFRELHRITGQRQRADPRVELATILLLDKAVMHLEADLRWLDMVESRLEDVRRQPLPQPEPRPRGRPPRRRETIEQTREAARAAEPEGRALPVGAGR